MSALKVVEFDGFNLGCVYIDSSNSLWVTYKKLDYEESTYGFLEVSTLMPGFVDNKTTSTRPTVTQLYGNDKMRRDIVGEVIDDESVILKIAQSLNEKLDMAYLNPEPENFALMPDSACRMIAAIGNRKIRIIVHENLMR